MPIEEQPARASLYNQDPNEIAVRKRKLEENIISLKKKETHKY